MTDPRLLELMRKRYAQDHVETMLREAHYQDGYATLPAYMLEQLADLLDVKPRERYYTEPPTASRALLLAGLDR